MRLDNFSPCDQNRSDRSEVPEWLIETAMNNASVKKRVKQYHPTIASNAGYLRGLEIAGATVLVILAMLNVFAGPADDLAAWTLFLKAVAR